MCQRVAGMQVSEEYFDIFIPGQMVYWQNVSETLDEKPLWNDTKLWRIALCFYEPAGKLKALILSIIF